MLIFTQLSQHSVRQPTAQKQTKNQVEKARWPVQSRQLASQQEARLQGSNWLPRQLANPHLPPEESRSLTGTFLCPLLACLVSSIGGRSYTSTVIKSSHILNLAFHATNAMRSAWVTLKNILGAFTCLYMKTSSRAGRCQLWRSNVCNESSCLTEILKILWTVNCDSVPANGVKDWPAHADRSLVLAVWSWLLCFSGIWRHALLNQLST